MLEQELGLADGEIPADQIHDVHCTVRCCPLPSRDLSARHSQDCSTPNEYDDDASPVLVFVS